MVKYKHIDVSNALPRGVVIYDAYVDDRPNKSLANFFGALTRLETLAARGSSNFEPIHGPISTYIVYDDSNDPVKRLFTLGLAAQTFSVEQRDLDIIRATQAFVTLMQEEPDSDAVKRFVGLITDGKGSPSAIDAFFKAEPGYETCTFISYMLVAVTLARTPTTRRLAPEQQRYSLSSLLKFIQVDWPPALPDIVLTQIHASDDGGALRLGGRLDARDVAFAEGVLDHVLGILPAAPFDFSLVIVTALGLSVGTTELSCVFDGLSIPIGGGKAIELLSPTATLSITPACLFVTFELAATIPFALFGGPKFDALASIIIDNAEAEIGVILDGGGHTLLTPAGIRGLHFDQFGVNMGLFFTPPGFALGIEGGFHIGDGQQAEQLDDNTFAIVCALDEGIPNPLYLSFYVPRLTLDRVLSIFTDRSMDVDVPITFTDLSFRWAENPMEPVALPDGTLAPMGYGFHADMDVLGFNAYVDVRLDLSVGIRGTAALDPLSLGSILRLTGDSPGVTIKVDADGNPIKNNVVPKTSSARDAVAHATTKALIEPGGAQFVIETSASPYLKLDADLAFLDFSGRIYASVAKDGIRFFLGFSELTDGGMHCILKNYHNFLGEFYYHTDWQIPLPNLFSMSLGSIQLSSNLYVTLSLTTSTHVITFMATAVLGLNGINYQIGPFELDQNISSITDVLSEIERRLIREAERVFAGLIQDARTWSSAVYSHLIQPTIQGAEGVIVVLKEGYRVGLDQMGHLLRGAPFQSDEVARALKGAFGADADGIARTLVTAYRLGPKALCDALHSAAFGPQEAASALSFIGFPAADAAKALLDVFHIAPREMLDVLRSVGYPERLILGNIPGAFDKIESSTKSVIDDIGGIF